MKAMLLTRTASVGRAGNPLELKDIPAPKPEGDEILIKVLSCGVCHTELDEIEGREKPRLPVVPGHEIVGLVVKKGPAVRRFRPGDRVGVGWIHSSCGKCSFCRSGRENLCPDFHATGRDVNGGYAEYTKVSERFAFKIPGVFSDSDAAPLLCAGGVGYRSILLSGVDEKSTLGLMGFGACGHLILQAARHKYPGLRVYVFARSREQRVFAEELGAHWAGATESRPPEKMDAIIDTTPAWGPPVYALRNLRPGGRLVINAIQKADSDKRSLLGIDYQRDIWLEKEIKSVANVTRNDIAEFLKIAAGIPIKPEIQEFRREDANRALRKLKKGRVRGALVLRP